jgi:hypothetical protein
MTQSAEGHRLERQATVSGDFRMCSPSKRRLCAGESHSSCPACQSVQIKRLRCIYIVELVGNLIPTTVWSCNVARRRNESGAIGNAVLGSVDARPAPAASSPHSVACRLSGGFPWAQLHPNGAVDIELHLPAFLVVGAIDARQRMPRRNPLVRWRSPRS